MEENILKKAQNKRILGNIAIEGGNFTAAYFKQTSLKELFDTSSSDDQPSTSQQLCTTKTSSEPVETSTEESAKDQMKSMEYEEVIGCLLSINVWEWGNSIFQNLYLPHPAPSPSGNFWSHVTSIIGPEMVEKYSIDYSILIQCTP